jgi:hypothetical protein
VIQQGLTTSFKQDMLQAQQNLATDTLNIALYTGEASIGPDTLVYATDNEVQGTGYTAGGETLTGVSVAVDGQVVFVTFSNVSWPGANFTARGALIYNASKSNRSVAVLDFGADRVFSSTNNTVIMPANTATTALIRFP